MRDDIERDRDAVESLIAETYAALSSGRPGAERFFAHPDIAIAGSGEGELVAGPEMAARMAAAVTWLGYRWSADDITVWIRGDVAWAQIVGTVTISTEGVADVVSYRTTGVFERDDRGWGWRYWGGAEPQASPRV
jgi:SnoaL-like domain